MFAEVLYALSDRPLPSASRRFALLGDLPLAAEYGDLIDLRCTGAPRVRLQAAADRVANLSPRFGIPTHDST